MQGLEEQSLEVEQQARSSGLIRAGLLGAILLLAAVGIFAIFGKFIATAQIGTSSKPQAVNEQDIEQNFSMLSAEWTQAKLTLAAMNGNVASTNQSITKTKAEITAQQAILNETEAAYARSQEAVSLANQKLTEANNDIERLLDDSLEQKVANASGNYDEYKLRRERAQQTYQSAQQEAERILAAVDQLRRASSAATAAAEASAAVATVADTTQISVDRNEDVVGGDSGGETLESLRSDFFNEAKAQADAAERSAAAAARATVAAEEKLVSTRARTQDLSAALDVASQEEDQARSELERLAQELDTLQKQRAETQRVAAIATERLSSETIRLDERKSRLQTDTLQLEELRASLAVYEKERDQSDIKIAAAQQVYDDAEAKLRDAQKERARVRAAKVATLNSEMHDKLRATLGNLRIENPNHDRFIVPSNALFESGSATLGPSGRILVSDISRVIKTVTDPLAADSTWMLRVDGHTDNTPLSGNGSHKDNWELSQARALAVVRFLVDEAGMSPSRLAANGLGQYQPLNPDENEAAKAENRRIELVLVPQ